MAHSVEYPDEMGPRLTRVLCCAVDNSGRSRRDIARDAGFHKDTFLRLLKGARPLTIDEAHRILNACGVPAPAVLCLVASGRDDLAGRWLGTGFVTFLDRLYRELPGALLEGLGERLEDIPSGWALGASRLMARQLARHAADLAGRDFL